MPQQTSRPPRARGRNFRKPRHQAGRQQSNRHQSNRRQPAKSSINPQRFVNQSTAPVQVVPYRPRHRFNTFAFDPRLHQAITAKGYTAPTAIQDQAIPHILAGRDLVGIANTGTGKTAGFILPIINRLLPRLDGMALIVAPTRELAGQIDEEFRSFAAKLGLRSAVCVGGLREGPQIRALKARPQMVIGTPGRLKDFVTNRHLNLDGCRTFVLDEADRMLDMGFIHDMKFLMQHLPEERQSLCFAATITPEVERIVQTLLTEPVTVSVRTRATSDNIDQNVIRANTPADKLAHLERLLAKPEFAKVLIFGETKHGVQRLSDKLAKRGITVTAIHGNKNQNQRQKALAAFKSNQVRVLVATDVAARGLDVPAVSHVVNYDVPKAYDDYIHRIGRTGRAGNRGTAVTFVPEAA